MSFLFIQLLSGLANAMFLFLVASGLTLIFGVTRIVNFAHGSFYMLAAYLTYALAAALPIGGAGFYAAVLAAAVATGLVGGAVEVILLRRVYRAPELYQLLVLNRGWSPVRYGQFVGNSLADALLGPSAVP